MTRRVLKNLEIVTWCVDDLAAAEAAWTRYLQFEVVDRSPIAQELATAWGTPAVAGCASRLLQPASGEPVYMRFIETGDRYGYEHPLTRGWTAAELLVEDPDALARQLQDSPFRRLAGPADLFSGPKPPRAMQMTGPCGELLYFTRILPGGSRYGMKQARSFVDRPFIVTIAGESMFEMQTFYGERLGMRIMETMPFINGILAHACGAAPNTIFPTCVSPIPGRRFLVEMDECPPGLPERPRQQDMPPPGMAMVSMTIEDLTAVNVAARSEARAMNVAPYGGRRVQVIAGAAGEWLELIEGIPG